MNYEQMMYALNALGECSIKMRKPGDWYVSQHVELKEGSILKSTCGNGDTPERAIQDHWNQLTLLSPGEYVVIDAALRDRRRAVRWNGFMWEDQAERLREAS